jgi:NAD(P)-dependent dehydrogenase (short-subunit alcohol dehydrogenase family)
MSTESRGEGAILRQFDLGGKVAVVTGASRGLGASMAEALAEAGADVALVARTEDALAGVAARVRELGRRAVPVLADVSRVASIEEIFERIARDCGRIDILVNAAGAQVRKPVLEVTEEDWDCVVAVNLKAVYFCSQAAARHMIGQGGGKIINIASLTSTIGILHASVYGATKGGVLSLTRSMALEWARYGISVNAIGPGYFATELTRGVHQDPVRSQWVIDRTPMGRWGVPRDLAGTVVFLASPASDFITGELINVDGGWLAS